MDLKLNGHAVSNDTLAPGWTDFNKRVYYRTYDVTSLLRQGTNVLGGAVAPGWYGGYLGWKYDAFYGPAPRLKLQLEVQFTDGTQAVIATGGEWQSARGPVWEADLLMGEHYAAAAELGPWTEPGYNYAAWQPVLVDEQANTAPLEAHPGNPVRPIEERPAQAISQPVPGTYIFDLGQNIVGRARLRVAAPAGTRIVLRHGEMLNADGTLYVTNLRRARATDVYLCRGSQPAAPETWEPRFTFHGFRYVEVTGLPAAPTLDAITGIVIHSAIERTGDFACSSPMLNQLFSNIMWGHRDNYLEVPTDCPQRDERLGWTGDAQVFIRTASYLSRIDAFFSKWLVDLSDGQNDAGAYPDIAPYLPGLGFGTPAWGDAGIVCPYMLWQAYGSTEILTHQWDSMVRFMQFLESTSKNLIRPAFGYGDWLCIDADTPKPLIGTAYFAWNCQLMAAMADALGRATEAHAYRALNAKIKAAFAREFVEPDGQLAGHTQTAYVIALHMNLLDETSSRQALGHLVQDIRNRDNALSVGFVGISYLCPVLARYGELDLAYTLLNSDRYPSWGYEIKNGATTIWERWNSYTHEHGFGDVRMNSFNHYAFGSIGEWMFEVIGGLSAAEPGYRTVHVRPRPGGGLTHARFAYQSCRGLLSTAWRVEDGQFHLELTVPPNTTALVELPPSATQAGASSSPLRVGSGRHQFSVELAAKPAAVALT
jgi:alpha-L-rhamnosidase